MTTLATQTILVSPAMETPVIPRRRWLTLDQDNDGNEVLLWLSGTGECDPTVIELCKVDQPNAIDRIPGDLRGEFEALRLQWGRDEEERRDQRIQDWEEAADGYDDERACWHHSYNSTRGL